MAAQHPLPHRPGEPLQHAHRLAGLGQGVVIDVDGVDVGALLLPIQALDVVLPPLVEVDGVVVDQHRAENWSTSPMTRPWLPGRPPPLPAHGPCGPGQVPRDHWRCR